LAAVLGWADIACSQDTAGSGRADGLKAVVAVGGFEVKAARAGPAIGDGLREMLVTALHQSGYFVVLERGGEPGGARLRDPRAAGAEGGAGGTPMSALEVADVMVYGAVTEFEPEAGGSSFMSPIMGAPLAMGARIRWSQMALDVRVVDVQSGRILAAQRIPGMARSAQATIAGAVPMGPMSVPAGLSVYRNTPMEWAIRDCIGKAAYFVVNSLDDEYFRVR
jgi:curli biogenesis system outer membrane secretion channel CsgG